MAGKSLSEPERPTQCHGTWNTTEEQESAKAHAKSEALRRRIEKNPQHTDHAHLLNISGLTR